MRAAPPSQPESAYAWLRLAASLALMTISGVGMYAVAVVLPAVQAEFGVSRSGASLPYAATMIGFGVGGILMGRLSDRFGVMVPVLIGAVCLGLGFVVAGNSSSLWQFVLAQGLLTGLLGTSAAFAPLVADTSLWFTRRRGIAVAICASGNYLAGALWPTLLQHYIEIVGWRETFIGVGLFCTAAMVPLAFALRRRPPELGPALVAGTSSMKEISISRDALFVLRTLLLGSGLQGVALLLFLPFDSLATLYVVAALFGLFQGGIVPSYAIIVREYFPPGEAGARLGTVLMCTLLGMALGGWMTGVIFDLTGSYRIAFLNGIGWNLLNLSIAYWLLRRSLPPA